MRVMAAVGAGRGDEEAAALFGVSTRSIGRRRVRFDAGGAEGLRSKQPGRKTSTCRFLTEAEEAALRQTMLECTPDDLGRGGLLWTTGKDHACIECHFKVRYCHGGLVTLFGPLGLSFRRPDCRAREANLEAMREWTAETYPVLRAQAEDENAVIMSADWVDARAERRSGRTRCAEGDTPVPAGTGKLFGPNAMSAISTRGRRYSTIFEDRCNAEACIRLLARLIGHFKGQKTHLVLYRRPVRKPRTVPEWATARKDTIERHFLPSCAPHLNPDALVDAYQKHQLTDRIITDRAHLAAAVRSIPRSTQKLPASIIGYFQECHTKYTLDTIYDMSIRED